MASLKKSARASRPKMEAKEDTSTDGVLDLSVTIGYLASDVSKEEILKLQRLLVDRIVAGLVVLERGDMEQHLHFQMVCRACVKSARSFGILVRKYMDWYGVKQMSPAGKVTCKVLTNHLLHTWLGMIGYCLKDTGLEHFEVVMHRISDADVEAGKTLHSIYGKADLKSRVVLTNKNIGEKAYVWYKYKDNHQLTSTMLSTLTDMIHSAMFIPSASWIVPVTGFGMEQRRMNSFWKCLVDPTNVERAEVADVFIRKREYVRGRYFDEEETPTPPVSIEPGDQYVYEASASKGKLSLQREEVGVCRNIPRTLQVPPLSARVKGEAVGKGRARNMSSRKKLFEDTSAVERPLKSVKFSDDAPDFIPLKDRAALPTNVFLPTMDVLTDSCISKTPLLEADFWSKLANASDPRVGIAGKKQVADMSDGDNKGGSKPSSVGEVLQNNIVVISSDSDGDEEDEETEVIELSSDSEGTIGVQKVEPCDAAVESLEGTKPLKKEVIELSSDSEGAINPQKAASWPDGAVEAFVDRKPFYYLATSKVSHVFETPLYRNERNNP